MLHFIIGLVLIAVFWPFIVRLFFVLLPIIFVIGFVALLAATNH